MGAEVILKEGYVEARAKTVEGATLYFDMPTVGERKTS
jgi:UDP-N-acetylglucosamine enolpyruvyl transferase